MIRKSVIHELPEFSIQLQQSCINKVAAVKSERFLEKAFLLQALSVFPVMESMRCQPRRSGLIRSTTNIKEI